MSPRARSRSRRARWRRRTRYGWCTAPSWPSWSSRGDAGAGEGLLAARVVGAAPEHAAFARAPARGHLDGAARAGRREEVALGGELEECERLLRQQRRELPEERGAVDELDVFLCREARGLRREAAGSDHHAFSHVRPAHGDAQLAQRLDADRVGVPGPAVHERAGGVGARREQADVDAAVEALARDAGPEAELLEIRRRELFQAPPLEVLEQLAGPFAGVQPLEPGGLAGLAARPRGPAYERYEGGRH